MKWSRSLTWLGVAIALFGVVEEIWLQVAISQQHINFEGAMFRLQNAALGVDLIASGALIIIAAQIMGMMQATRDQSSN